MDFKGKGFLKSNPCFKVKGRLDPLHCHGSLSACGEGEIGEISFNIDEVPINMTIPFMKCRQPVLVASVGSIKGRINPFSLKLKKGSVKFDAVCGCEGIEGEMDGTMHYSTEIEADGEVSGKLVAKPTVEVDLAPEEEKHGHHRNNCDTK